VRFQVEADVMPKEGIADPQGQTIERALPSQGFAGIEGVRVGKRIEFWIEAADARTAETTVETICSTFLSNPIIEDFSFHIRVPEDVSQ
jgi:phosphoribosylformylglycinamidine synthase subunit PurS